MSTTRQNGLTRRGHNLRRVRYLPRARLADMLEAIIWLSVAVVIALFLADSGAADFLSVAGSFTGAGIIAGLVGTNLLLIQLLLAARLPVIDRAFGHDVALATHQKMGKPIFYLITAHVLLLWIGYALTAHTNPLAEVFVMLNTLPDMKTAYLGYGLLVLVVFTSLVVVRRKFPYETWHAVHLLAYLSVLVALPHQFSTSRLFANGTGGRYYWLLLYFAVAAAVLVYRFLIPVLRTIRHGLRVSDVTAVARGVYTIEMTGRGLVGLQARGGQFFVWRFFAHGQWWHAHPFSLSAAPAAQHLQVTVRELGRGTSGLGGLPVGTRVGIEGPYGLFTDRARTTGPAVAVAAGIGITPILSLLEHGDFAAGEMTVIVRARDKSSLYLYEELQRLCAQKSAPLYVLLGRRPRNGGDTWLPAREANQQVRLSTIVADLADRDVFICGPRQWADLVVADARRSGVKKFRIHRERFNW